MTVMRDEGKIMTITLSRVILEVPRGAVHLVIGCVQNAFSLVAHDTEDVVQLCVSEGIAWVPYFPLDSAFPGMYFLTPAEVWVNGIELSSSCRDQRRYSVWRCCHRHRSL
jgi:pyridoxine 4-dehydrogenase